MTGRDFIDLGKLVLSILPIHPFHSLEETPDEFTQKITGFEEFLTCRPMCFTFQNDTHLCVCSYFSLHSHLLI